MFPEADPDGAEQPTPGMFLDFLLAYLPEHASWWPWPYCFCDQPAAPWALEGPYCAFHWPIEDPGAWFRPAGMSEKPRFYPAFARCPARPWATETGELEARLSWVALKFRVDRGLPPFPDDKPAHTPRQITGGLFAQVKAAVSVEALAGRFTTLQQAGQGRLKGRCPLHQERTPSFYIYQERGYWRCYGACARGGDVIALAQELMDLGKLLNDLPH